MKPRRAVVIAYLPIGYALRSADDTMRTVMITTQFNGAMRCGTAFRFLSSSDFVQQAEALGETYK
jgi:hypothetical protein